MNNDSGHVFPRRLDAPLPKAAMTEGVWIEDDQGQRYIDASGGAAVVNLGHGREEIAQAVYDQIISHHYVHPTMFTTPAVEVLAARLAKIAPGDVDRFYFMSSGSEAVETAVKLARQVHLTVNGWKKCAHVHFTLNINDEPVCPEPNFTPRARASIMKKRAIAIILSGTSQEVKSTRSVHLHGCT